MRDEKDRRQVNVEVTPARRGARRRDLGPLGADAQEWFARMSVEELKSVIKYHEAGRDLNERHIERVRKLDFDED